MNVLLVIAEDRSVWEALRASLPEGDLILHEPSVATARRRIASVNVDAIFLDDTSLSGENLVEAVKDMAPGVPLAVLSNREDLLTQAALTRSGANAVLAKPFSCDSLQEALASLLHTTVVASVVEHHLDRPSHQPVFLGQHQMALRWISRLTGCKDDMDRLSRRLMESAVDIFDATRCCLLLEQNGRVAVGASHGLSEHITGQLRLSFSAGLMHWFDSHACLFDIHAIRSAPQALKELQVLNGVLAAPLMRNGQVFGALILGEKASGLSYLQEERELLTLFIRSVEILFEDRSPYRIHDQTPPSVMAGDLPVGLVSISPDRKIVAMNKRAESLLQLPAAKVLGGSVQKLGSAFADVVLRSMGRKESRFNEVIRDPVSKGELSLNVAPDPHGGATVVFLP
ncbi:MAG: GAF domain-containing protein, partial [Flavobacteriales bacterium]|nr:GAF domain-containing protein [Flavobacteriales bacterium]